MIRISSFDQELESQGIQKEITHPLWHGLKVLALPAKQNNFYASLFLSKAYIPLGDGLYTSSLNRPFVEVWNLYKNSGKNYEGFQAEVLKSHHPSIPTETKIAAAIALAKGEGYCDRDLIVRQGAGWREVASEIAIIFPRTTKPLGKGGFGVVREANGLLINPEQNNIQKTTFALKEPQDDDAEILLLQGMKLLKKIWGQGLVRPSAPILLPNGRRGLIVEWAMSTYTSDFRAWSKKNRQEPLKIVKAFLTAFDGLKILQDNLVVHLDLKPQNLLVLDTAEDLRVDINDFDACFVLPTTIDIESLKRFKEDLKDFAILRTPHYCRTADSRKFREQLSDLRTLLETEESDREDLWFETFSKRLSEASNLLKQIQIHEWGWSLIVALTNTPPHRLLSTTKTGESNSKLKEPTAANIKKTLSEIDEDLRDILFQAVTPEPSARLTFDIFKTAVVDYLERKKIDQTVSSSKHGYLDGTLPTKPLLGKSSTGRIN